MKAERWRERQGEKTQKTRQTEMEGGREKVMKSERERNRKETGEREMRKQIQRERDGKHSRIESEGEKQGTAPPPGWKRSQMAIRKCGER